MRAFAVEEFGQPGHVVDLPDPQPAAGEILLRVHAASVNPMDAFIASGGVAQWAEVRKPIVPGLDAAGTVAAVGDGVTEFKPGDDVVVTASTKPFFGAGTFAELVTVPSSAVAGKPDAIDDATAASVPQAGLTALAAVDALALKPGDDVAVIGATGGVGSWFVQLAKERGANVIAIARASKGEYALDLGADAVVDYTASDCPNQVRGLAPDGLDALADFSGDSEMIEMLSGLLRGGGRVATSAARLDTDAYAARGLVAAQANRAAPERLAEILQLVADGKLKPPQTRVMPLEDAGRAIDEVSQKHTTGKVVLTID
jgi:NADPH:quinone reductase-like Zn-dependent oxidoreductase